MFIKFVNKNYQRSYDTSVISVSFNHWHQENSFCVSNIRQLCKTMQYMSKLSTFLVKKYHNCFTAIFRGRDHPGEPVPEENFWTLWFKGRLTEADTPTIRLGATPSGLSSAHLHHPPFFTGWMPFLPPNHQCQSTEGN